MKLRIGFSPCPNDTFIFDALINKKIDTGHLDFEAVLEDVQTLNQCALRGELDLTKISYGALPLVLEEYIVLESGGALGQGVGPLVISKSTIESLDSINQMRVAIPGEHTTAHMLFSLAFPTAKGKYFTIFSNIENAVINGEADAGVIIHENRFTYQDKGLVKIIDLGEYWEKRTGLPIPLGGIVAKRSMSQTLRREVDHLIGESIKYAFSNYPVIATYVKQHSQEMDETVMRQHIDLYVNNYSRKLGDDGKKAVIKFLEIYQSIKQTYPADVSIFSE